MRQACAGEILGTRLSDVSKKRGQDVLNSPEARNVRNLNQNRFFFKDPSHAPPHTPIWDSPAPPRTETGRPRLQTLPAAEWQQSLRFAELTRSGAKVGRAAEMLGTGGLKFTRHIQILGQGFGVLLSLQGAEGEPGRACFKHAQRPPGLQTMGGRVSPCGRPDWLSYW